MRKIDDIVQRYKTFYSSDQGALMVLTDVAAGAEDLPEDIPLNRLDWKDEAAIRRYARSHLNRIRESWKRQPFLDDDRILSFQNLAGTGAIAAAFVKDPVVHHEEDTNYLEPPIKDWNDGVDRIGFDPRNLYYQAQMVMLRTYIEDWDGNYGILPFTHFDPFDLANQFRGNSIFYDLQDEAENLHALLRRNTTCILQLEQHMRENYIRGYDLEGICLGLWCPAGNYLSCDIGDMVSRSALEEFGRPYFDSIVSEWGGAFLHHHELGLHQIDVWSESPKLSVQFLNRDPNTKHLAQARIIDEAIIASTFRVPIAFIADYDEFMTGADSWSKGKFVVHVICESPEQARMAVRKARSLRGF